VVPQVAASWDHSCSLNAAGKVTCWGDSSYYVVSDTPNSGVFTKLAMTGYRTVCATKAPTDELLCWGYPTWADTAPKASVLAFAGGQVHGCAIRKDTKQVQCWGSGSDGQLNAPSNGPYISVGSASYSSCAVRQTGELDCWGWASEFVGKPSTGTFKKVVGAGNHYCGLTASGEVSCWGSPGSYSLTTNFFSAERFVDLALSETTNCFLLADGRLRCSGEAYYGALAPPLDPADVWTSAGVSYGHGCGLRRGGGVVCWGRNASGQASPPGAASCGNGSVEPIEACDDGNRVSGDGCEKDCKSREVCGNGITDPGEACDDGTGVHRDTCDNACQNAWASLPFPAPQAHVNFDESARYLSTYANLGTGPLATATIHGSGVAVAQPSQTASSSALFSGSADDYISLPSTVEQPTSVTVAVWVNQIAPAGGASSIAYHRSSPGALAGWSFEPAAADGGQITFRAGNAATGVSSSVAAGGFPLGVWTHLAATYDATTSELSLYIDGELAATTLAAGFTGIGHLSSSMRLGEGLAGYLDEFAVWNSALDPAYVAQLYDYGRQGKALRSQYPSTTYVSPCARELQRNPSATSGVYNLAIGSDAEAPVPVFCDMTDGGWTLLFKKSAGASTLGAEALWFGTPVNELDITLMNRAKSAKDYVNRLAAMPKYFAEARLELATAGVTQKNIVFDVIEAARHNWFTPARIKSSSWMDLPTQANWDLSLDGRHFSIHGSGGRDFYIHNNWGGCSADQGWMMFSNVSSCSFDGGTTGKILYASGATKQISTSMAQAETLMVFGR
jgi:cysteine-rich repeat protein